MSEITIDQKIELLKIAAATTARMGAVSGNVDDTLSGYNKLVDAILSTTKP